MNKGIISAQQAQDFAASNIKQALGERAEKEFKDPDDVPIELETGVELSSSYNIDIMHKAFDLMREANKIDLLAKAAQGEVTAATEIFGIESDKAYMTATLARFQDAYTEQYPDKEPPEWAQDMDQSLGLGVYKKPSLEIEGQKSFVAQIETPSIKSISLRPEDIAQSRSGSTRSR